MRWIFANAADSSDSSEERLRQQKRDRIDQWWRAFAAKASDLDALFRGHVQWDLPAWMRENLQVIEDRLCWEFGAEPDGHHVVITPEGTRHLRPLTDVILAATRRLPGWRFYPYRQPDPPDFAGETVKARTRGDLSQTTVRVRAGRFNTLHLTFVSPQCRGPEDRDALGVAFAAAESLLGEETLDKWVGVIDVSPPTGGERTYTLDRLRPTVEAVVEHIREQMPASPYH